MRRLIVAAVVGLLLGCQQSPAPGPDKVPPGSLTAELRAQGDRLAARGDYAGAVVKYQAAVGQERGDSALWFALGVALSHLDRREDTTEAFRRVVDLGQPDSEEVRLARSWLVRAGVLTEPVSFTPSRSGDAADFTGPPGALRGRTHWEGLSAKSRLFVRFALTGDDSSTTGRKFFISNLKLGEPYVFEDVPAGAYRLAVHGGATQLWDQRVVVHAGSTTVLDLSPANSPVPPREYPITSEMRAREEEYAKYAKPGESHVPGRNEPPPAGARAWPPR